MSDDLKPVRPRRLVRRRRPRPDARPVEDAALPAEAQDAIKGFGMIVAGATLVAKAAAGLVTIALAVRRYLSH